MKNQCNYTHLFFHIECESIIGYNYWKIFLYEANSINILFYSKILENLIFNEELDKISSLVDSKKKSLTREGSVLYSLRTTVGIFYILYKYIYNLNTWYI